MATTTEKAERQDRILAELSELGLALARDLHARALVVEDVAEAADLGLAFHRVARSVRQTLALEAKLDRDRRMAEREDRADVRREGAARAERRKAQVKFAVERCVWSEADGVEAERLLDELDDRLEEDGLSDAFAGQDAIDSHIARICTELGVTVPGRADSEPSPGDLAAPAPTAIAVLATGTAPGSQVDEPAARRSSG